MYTHLSASFSHRVIHEFDPWFNFRATQYLADNGWHAFFHWFDYESWYPLGRPVGTTIYPGMQIAAVGLWKAINAAGYEMSLNDVCVYIPAWFGVVATLFLAILARECSGNSNVGVAAAGIMSIIPAHLMRSVGGGYDNESVAMTCMCATFYFWCRSLRTDKSWAWGIVTGLAYMCMVATWGGFVFVLNMIGVHAACLVLLGRYSAKLHRAYSLFFIIGTWGAMRVPVVGKTPLTSLEQLGAMAVFLGLQVLAACDWYSTRSKHTPEQRKELVRNAVLGSLGAGAVGAAILFPTGYFGPLSSRVRGLFVQHTRTGNPLVDSVAEHQPASGDAYFKNLHHVYYIAPIGFFIALTKRTDANLFIVFYAAVAYYFSNRMARLIILLGPIASVLGGVAVVYAGHWALTELFALPKTIGVITGAEEEGAEDEKKKNESSKEKEKKKGKVPGPTPSKGRRGKKGKNKQSQSSSGSSRREEASVTAFLPRMKAAFESKGALLPRLCLAVLIIGVAFYSSLGFYTYSHYMAKAISNPSLMYQARLGNGQVVMVDDYREAYWWLRDNTPEDSRVMAWWDYGYQINGIANRTTIADGNTWNHEHIATLARCLTSPVKQAHRMIRHLADYVLVWAGGGGDDLAKSPHLARICTSVYHDHCKGDIYCRQFGFTDRERTPTPMMRKSLLYQLHSHKMVPGVEVDENRFREVFKSK